MKFFIIFLVFIVSEAFAETSIVLEHPRYPSVQKDLYKATCETTCDVEINSHSPLKGKTKSLELQKKIQQLINLEKQGEFPKISRDIGKTLYKGSAGQGDKKISFVISYPKAYSGKEYDKFTTVISLLEEIKDLMTKDLAVTP